MMHYRIAHACAALAATVALGAATPSFAQGRDKAGPKAMSAPTPTPTPTPQAAMMAPPPPPAPAAPPAPTEPAMATMPATAAYAACTATVRDQCTERAPVAARERHYPR